jgi:hypothetical protein
MTRLDSAAANQPKEFKRLGTATAAVRPDADGKNARPSGPLRFVTPPAQMF